MGEKLYQSTRTYWSPNLGLVCLPHVWRSLWQELSQRAEFSLVSPLLLCGGA